MPVAPDDAADDTVVPPAPGPIDDPFGDTVVRPAPGPIDDPFGDTVVRPRRGARTPDAGPASDQTVLRPVPEVPRRSDGDPFAAPPRPPGQGAASRGVGAGLPAGDTPAPRVPSIRIGNHVVRLDRPVVVGRRPALPRIVRGPEPQLVTVRSVSGQVSSSHLLVHASGEAAVVEDLRSTNGTVVRPVAGAPFRMPSGGSVVVLTGTVVEIGDGNVIEILSPHLRVAPRGTDPAPPGWP